MRFKSWFETMLPYDVLNPGITFANDPAKSVVASKYYGPGEIKEKPAKVAKFGKIQKAKVSDASPPTKNNP